MFPLPMLATIPDDLDSIDSRFAFRYHLAFMKNTILRALNNIHTHAREFQCDDPRLTAFFEYIEGFCDVLMLHIRTDERLFHTPMFAGVALVKLSGEGCVQDMRRVLRGAEKLKKLAQKYASKPKHYDGDKVIARLSFGREFSARSWAQIHSIDVERLQSACQESEMRQRIHKTIASFSEHPSCDFLIPFIHSHHDKETSKYWPRIDYDARITVPCLAKKHSRSWELAPFDVSTGRLRRSRESQAYFGMCIPVPNTNADVGRYYRTCKPMMYHVGQ